MFFSNLKTSTQISIKFTLFTILQVLFFGILANSIFFFNWYNQENHKLSEGQNIERRDQPRPVENDENHPPIPDFFPRRTESFDLNSSEAKSLAGSRWFNSISKIDDGYFMYKIIDNKVFVSDITPHVNMQMNLILISIFLTIMLSLIAYFLSLVFVESSLKKLNKLNEFLETLNIDNLDKKIEIAGHPEDEINKVSEKFNEALDKVNKQTLSLKDFIKNASHEIKTPLMSISTEIDFAKKSTRYEEGLDNVKSQIKLINRLMDSLLEITKTESTVNIKKEKINTGIETKTISENLKNLYKFKNIELEEEIENDIFMEVNPEGWNIIIKNLLDNAFKYTPKNGNIELILNKENLIIKDSGIGISPENLENIWERFWQADESHTDTKSFGLGLYLTKLLTEKHGWKIQCESEIGKGTTFKIIFYPQ